MHTLFFAESFQLCSKRLLLRAQLFLFIVLTSKAQRKPLEKKRKEKEDDKGNGNESNHRFLDRNMPLGARRLKMGMDGPFWLVFCGGFEHCSLERYMLQGARRTKMGVEGLFWVVFCRGIEHCSKLLLGVVSGPKYAPERSEVQNGHGWAVLARFLRGI